ncbi:MAG: hypothetical protein ACO1SV_06130 [Fimbriimonas sp.]
MRTVFIVLGLLGVLLITLTLRATGSNRDLLRYTGKWEGGFTIESIQKGKDTEEERHRNRIVGFVQIYLTNRKYTLHLEGAQQAIDVDGIWVAKDDRVTLTPKNVKIDDKGGPEQRDPNKPYIPNEAVQAAYNRPMTLVQSPDKQRYEGLAVTVGDFLGKHQFAK